MNSPMITKKITKKEGIFFYQLLLTFFFFLFEVSFFVQCNRIYLSDYTFVSHHLKIPLTILPGIFYFIAAQIFIHFIYCLLTWCIALSIANLFHWSGTKKLYLALTVWFVGIFTILAANQYFYPNSKVSELSAMILRNDWLTQIVFLNLLIIFLLLIFLTILNALKITVKKPKILLSFLVVIALGVFYKVIPKNSVTIGPNSHLPNIILIGVDSLRPDFLSFFGSEQNTPFFDSFLKQGVVFAESVTPLARTFPSWTGILTGLYPRESGARSNLIAQHSLKLDETLPRILQKKGYYTVFATDETRFSNIGTNFGFNQIITPPMGLNDFLIGNFNDFPLSNLLINTPVGKWLFPYSYGNRPVYYTYSPNSFLKLLQPTIEKKRIQPLFFAVHFCLPHFPYLWADFPAIGSNIRERYAASVQHADMQVNNFLIMLKQNHLLDHAIVVLLSDHGETLEFAGDRITEKELYQAYTNASVPQFYQPSLDDEAINQTSGHGSDVLGLPQYHTVLAFQLYGFSSWKPKVMTGVVSLLDIKPTILELLQLPSSTTNGDSLAKLLFNDQTSIAQHQPIFMESDFTPESIRTVYPETSKVMMEGIHIFQIDPKTTRLEVKKEMEQMIIKSKQVAIIEGQWILALYPQNNHQRMPVLVNLVTGQWTNDLRSDFAKQSPVKAMLVKLKAFYGEEINTSV